MFYSNVEDIPIWEDCPHKWMVSDDVEIRKSALDTGSMTYTIALIWRRHSKQYTYITLEVENTMPEPFSERVMVPAIAALRAAVGKLVEP
jgi:hypothetical protein